MKERVLTGWTFTRALYVLIGVLVSIDSAMQQQWFAVAFGAYFASMGIFGFGCAGGVCRGGTVHKQQVTKDTTEIQEAEFKSLSK